MYRILVADDLSDEGIAILERVGRVTRRAGLDVAQLRDALPGQHALVVRTAKVTAPALERADDLIVIGRAGVGAENVDVRAATERGIVVMNTPESGMVTTAEHAVALLLALARNVPAADAAMKAGRWDDPSLTGTEVRGKTLGVLGLGRIGSVVATRAQGLQMEVIAYDPYVEAERAPAGVRMVSLDELLEESDFLSVHAPLTDETHHLLDEEALRRMKAGARIVQAARGGIVDEEALCDVLESGHLAGAAIDVFEEEPLPAGARLRQAPRVILTPHLGASTAEAARNVSVDIAHQVVTCLETGVCLHGLNVPRIPPAEATRVAPFLSLTRNVSNFLLQVFPGRLEALRLTLQGPVPSASAAALTGEMLVGALRNRADRPVTVVNAEAIAEAMGVRVHAELGAVKRDFVNVVRIEATIDRVRHLATGTVLGRRHGRLVELDDWMIDAIPEGPMLVTFHRDHPGVLGEIGQILGEEHVNISRIEVEGPTEGDGPALGILNLSAPLAPHVLDRLRARSSVLRAFAVEE
jgi:D-3-phosphoglycerate dehydrogenase